MVFVWAKGLFLTLLGLRAGDLVGAWAGLELRLQRGGAQCLLALPPSLSSGLL